VIRGNARRAPPRAAFSGTIGSKMEPVKAGSSYLHSFTIATLRYFLLVDSHIKMPLMLLSRL
jgi:hypothetical protein